jgi:hypothetical protein
MRCARHSFAWIIGVAALASGFSSLPDGVLVSAESGSSWIGSWKIRNNQLCLLIPASASLEM